MKRYTKELASSLGLLLYGVAQVYDVDVDEVCEEAWEVLTSVPHPKALFGVDEK